MSWRLLAEHQLRRANARLVQGQTTAAEAEFRNVPRPSADAPRKETMSVAAAVHVGLGRVALRRAASDGWGGAESSEYLPESIRHFEEAVTMWDGHWRPQYWLGCALAWSGELERAEAAFRAAQHAAPDRPRIAVERAKVHVLLDRGDEALAALRAADGTATLDACDRVVLADLLMRSGRTSESRRIVEDVLVTSPDLASATLLWANHVELDQPEAALELYREVAAADNAMSSAAEGHLEVLRATRGETEPEITEPGDIGDDVHDLTLLARGEMARRRGDWETCQESWTALAERRAECAELSTRAQRDPAFDAAAGGRLDEALNLVPDLTGEGQAERAQLEGSLRATYLRWLLSVDEVPEAALAEARDQVALAQEALGDDPRMMLLEGVLAHLQGENREAATRFRELSAEFPDSPGFKFGLAACEGAEGEADHRGAGSARLRASGDDAVGATARPRAVHGASRPTAASTYAAWLFAGGYTEELVGVAAERFPAIRAWQGIVLAEQRRLEEAERVLAPLDGDVRHGEEVKPILAAVRESLLLDCVERKDWSSAAAVLRSADRVVAGLRRPASIAQVQLQARRYPFATRVLASAWRAAPMDGEVLHALILTHLYEAKALEADAAPAHVALRAWDSAIAAFVVLVGHPRFWDEWCEEITERYGVDTVCEPSLLRDHVERKFHEIVAASRERDSVERALRHEMFAAVSLGEAGGLPARGERLRAGPRAVMRLGRGDALRALGAEAPAQKTLESARDILEHVLAGEADDPGRPQDVHVQDRLARVFSALGPAQEALEAGRPDAALSELRDLGCGVCHGQTRRTGSWTPRVCKPDCALFAARNPGFPEGEEGGKALRRAADTLALEACLAAFRMRLRDPDLDLGALGEHWDEALRFERLLGETRSARQKLTELLLGRARGLMQAKRLDDAVDLLTWALETVAPNRRVVKGKLAGVLVDRGVHAGNQQRFAEAVADLERAWQLNPNAKRAFINLTIARNSLASELGNEGALEEALALADQNNAFVTEERRHFGADSAVDAECERTGELVVDLSRAWVMELRQRGVSAFNDGRGREAAECLGRAMEASESPEEIRSELSMVLSRTAVGELNDLAEFPEPSRLADAKAMLEEALRLDPDNEHAQLNLGTVRRLTS